MNSVKKPVAVAKLIFNAGEAKPGPPVGPVLAQFQLNIANVCKELNEQSLKRFAPATPIPAKIAVFADKTHRVALGSPTLSSLIFHFRPLVAGGQPLTLVQVYDLFLIHRHGHPRFSDRSLLRQVLGSLRSARLGPISF